MAYSTGSGSPGEQMHHVYWCPEAFPASFAAEWEMQNLHPQAGLCIVFFAATGLDGQDVHDPALPARDGTFSQYNKGELKNYHISYYANTPNLPARPVARLRKNPGAVIVHEGPPGIVADSTEIHRVRLMKDRAQIALWVDDRLIIDWTDNGTFSLDIDGTAVVNDGNFNWNGGGDLNLIRDFYIIRWDQALVRYRYGEAHLIAWADHIALTRAQFLN